MRRAVAACLALCLFACAPEGVTDLKSLEADARRGDAAAFERLVTLLGVSENDLNDRTYEILLGLGLKSVPYLLERVADSDRHLRERVIAALGTLKVSDAVPLIVQVLQNPDLKRRYIAAWALGEINDPRALDALIAALEDPDTEVRKYATRSLIKFNKAAVDPLVRALGSLPHRAQGAAILALGDIGDPRALEPLLTQAQGGNRAEVFLALGKLKDSRAERALVQGLKDPRWQVRMNAAMALGPLGGDRAAEAQRLALEDEVTVVREWSARSLSMITGQAVHYRNGQGQQVPPYNVYH